VSINGYDLTDNEQAMQMLSELPEQTELTLTVERDGQLHQVFISLQQ
jgi:general secretion pathway protein C